MKVAKEQIVGMVAAVDWLLEQNDEALEAEYMRRVEIIKQAVKNIPTLTASINIPEVANHVPHLMLTYDPKVVGITPKQVQERLQTTTPVYRTQPGYWLERSLR